MLNVRILIILLFISADALADVNVGYSFEKATAEDDSGVYIGSLANGAEILKMKDGNHVLFTGTSNGYMDLGASIGNTVIPQLTGDFTISIDVYEPSSDNNLSKDGNFLWCFSSQEPSTSPSNYMMMRIKNSATGYTMRYNGSNYRLGESNTISTDKWVNITYVHESDSAFLYIDGEKIEAKDYSQNSQNFGPQPQNSGYISPADLYNNVGSLAYNYIGRSSWSTDAYVKNAYIDNFEIVDSAETQQFISNHCEELENYSTEVDYGESSRNAFTILNSSITLAERLQTAGVTDDFIYDGNDILSTAESMVQAATASKQEADSVASLLTKTAVDYISGTVAAKASETNTYPLTGLIVNPSFATVDNSSDEIKGWEGDVVLNDSSTDGTYTDTYLKYNTCKFDVYQQFDGLPTGTYRIEASTKISYILEKYLYATTAKGTLKSRMIVSDKGWALFENSDSLNTVLDSVVVTDGHLKIGFCGESSTNDAMIDNVTLCYVGDGTSSDAYNQTDTTTIVIPEEVTSADLPSSDDVKSIIEKVNDYWQSNNSADVNSFWYNAVYETGNMAAYSYTENEDYRDYALTWANYNNWYGSTGDDSTQWKYTYGEGSNYALFGDWQCCFQTYIDLYNSDEEKPDYMVARAKQVMSYMMEQDTVSYWWWADALYMAMPVMTKMYDLTGDEDYLQKMYDCFVYARDLMYDEDNHLFFRDASYVYPSHSTTRGLPDYWSRGDGWVVAGLAKILNDMPQSYKHYDYFESIYKDMISAVVKCQKSEGYWTESIGDTLYSTCYESSGTCLYTYALLWGVNNGILDECTYFPYIKRAWNYLTTIALQDDGSVGYMQPIGGSASENAVLYPTNVTNFGTGAFLLAACEMGKYADSKVTNGITSVSTDPINRKGIFSLDGKRLDKPVKGINIINGKKVVIR